LIDSVLVSSALTVIFGAAGVMFTVRRGARSPATVSDRLSHGIHVAGCAAMIVMSWRWAPILPIWSLEATFTLAGAWFCLRAVHGRRAGTRTDGPRWPDVHHAVMAGALTWSIAAMSDLRPSGTVGRDDMMTAHHHLTAAATPHPANAVATLGLTAYFILAAWPWLSMAVRAARNSDDRARRQSRRGAAEATSHALMSIGMAAMFAAMA
jgi:hypothetical protein